MTPEQIKTLEHLVEKHERIHGCLSDEEAHAMAAAMALAKSAIPSEHAAEDATLLAAAIPAAKLAGHDAPALRSCISRLAAKAQAHDAAADALADVAEAVLGERPVGAMPSATLDAVQKVGAERDALKARNEELEQGRTALAEALSKQGQALAAAEEELRRLKPLEALANKHGAALVDTTAALDMYATACKRELGAFYRAKRHEIDGLVVSTQDMAEKAGEAEALRKNLADAQKDAAASAEEVERLKAKVAELEEAISGAGGWRDVLAVESALLKEEREEADRLLAAGQVPSERVAKAPEWTMRDEFAKAAMQGLIAVGGTFLERPGIAKVAYLMADSMIAERATQ